MRNTAKLRWLSMLAALWLMVPIAEPFEAQAKIQGIIYISPSGEPEGDLVMRAGGTEVLLLRGDGGLETELAKLRQNRSPMIAKQLQAVGQAQELLLRSTVATKEEMEKRSSQLRQERAKLADLREAYQKEVSELMAKHTVAKTKTDSEGRFGFPGIPAGRYLIHSHFEITGMDIHYYWLLPVELQSEKQPEISLNKLNATPTF